MAVLAGGPVRKRDFDDASRWKVAKDKYYFLRQRQEKLAVAELPLGAPQTRTSTLNRTLPDPEPTQTQTLNRHPAAGGAGEPDRQLFFALNVRNQHANTDARLLRLVLQELATMLFITGLLPLFAIDRVIDGIPVASRNPNRPNCTRADDTAVDAALCHESVGVRAVVCDVYICNDGWRLHGRIASEIPSNRHWQLQGW